jgi:hypothetical protein
MKKSFDGGTRMSGSITQMADEFAPHLIMEAWRPAKAGANGVFKLFS